MSECYELLQLSKAPSTAEGKEAWEIKRMKAQAEINTRMITLIHSLFQVSQTVEQAQNLFPGCCFSWKAIR